MSNIVYVLTNEAMPGIVKIGMTSRSDVQHRMADLYTTGVPLPFDCVIAREIDDREAIEIEDALHTAFGPNRVNPSREFFELDPEQIVALLRVLPGRDVTPQVIKKSEDGQLDDRKAAQEFRRRRSQTNERAFMQSLSDNGVIVYEKVLAMGKQSDMRIKWGTSGFSLNAISDGNMIVVCYGSPPSSFNQRIDTSLGSLLRKTSVTKDVVESLREDALNSGLFRPVGKGIEIACETDRTWDEAQLSLLTGWLSKVIERIRECETEDST